METVHDEKEEDFRADADVAGRGTAPEPATRTSLKFYHAMGFGGVGNDQEPPSRNIADHLNDDSLVYLAGKHVAVYSYETQKSHRFILKNPKTSRIVAFCVSPNRRYVALSEILVPEPNGGIQVSVYNFNTASKVRELGRSRFPSNSEGTQPVVVGLDFSRDNKYLATVTSPPNPHIYLWQLDKQRLAGMAEVTHRVTQISVSPWAHWELCTTGTSMLKLWRAQGNQLKATDPLAGCSTPYKFSCHSWFDSEKLVVGTEEGDILVIENQELKKVMPAVHGPGRGITCICTVSRGFVAGGDEAVLSLFERTYDSEYFKCFKIMHTPDRFLTNPKIKVLDVTINPGEESAICCYENNEILQISLNQIEHLEDKQDKHNVFKRLPIGFHSDTVTGADVCVQKSVLVTSSVDRHIRVWNFIKKTIEIDKKFDEDVLSVAIHPSGYILVAGFRFKLCVFVVLANDLQLCHDFPNIKQCREVRFSQGGQYFAAVGNPWSRIVVVNSYTMQPLGSGDNPNGVPLTGHSASVQSICWSNTDQQLISAGSEGAIYEWRISENGGKRNELNESVIKSVSYQCIRYDDDSQMLVALGSHKPNSTDRSDAGSDNDTTLRTMRFTMEYPAKAPQRVLSKPIRIPSQPSDKSSKQPRVMRSCQTAISPLAQTLFVGTTEGQLWLYEWPPSDQKATPEPYSKLEVHQGEILFVVLSLDERHLFTIGAEDKCLFMFNVDIVSDGRPVSRKPYPYAAFDNVAFISQQEFDERARIITELSSHNEELIRRQQAEIEALNFANQRELEQVEGETVEELNSMRRAMEESIAEAEEAKEQAQRHEQGMTEAHMKTAEELEALHTKRIDELEKRHRHLADDKDDLVIRYENKLHKLRADIEGEKKQLEMQYKETEQKLAGDVEQLRREIRELYKSINGMVDTTIHDYIIELDGGPGVEGLHEKWKAILAAKESQCSQSKTNTALFKTRREKHKKEIEELEQQIERRKEQERLLIQKSQEHLKSNESLKAEIAQRNDTISASERRILELKKQTAELEKLRYVLTFKFSELRKEVAPKEEKIKEMNESIQDMDLDLERIGIERDNLQQLLSEKDSRIQSLMSSLANHNKILDDKERSTEQLLRELINLVAEMDGSNLRECLLEMVNRYSIKYEEDVGASYEKEKAQEFARQRMYMESQLESVDKNNRMKESLLRQDNQVKTAENAQLVKEINVMRNEKKQLVQRLQQSDSQLKELHAQAQRIACNKDIRTSRPYSAPVGMKPRAANEIRDTKTPPLMKGVHGRGPVTGRLIRGSTRSLKDLCDMNPHKLDEIVSQVEQTNACIKKQSREISSLKEYIKDLLQGAENAAANGELLGTALPSVQ